VIGRYFLEKRWKTQRVSTPIGSVRVGIESVIGKEMEKQSGQPSVPNKCRYFIYASSLKNVNVWEVGLLAQVTTRSAWAN
jgi:hypothetical protein